MAPWSPPTMFTRHIATGERNLHLLVVIGALVCAIVLCAMVGG